MFDDNPYLQPCIPPLSAQTCTACYPASGTRHTVTCSELCVRPTQTLECSHKGLQSLRSFPEFHSILPLHLLRKHKSINRSDGNLLSTLSCNATLPLHFTHNNASQHEPLQLMKLGSPDVVKEPSTERKPRHCNSLHCCDFYVPDCAYLLACTMTECFPASCVCAFLHYD